MACTTSHSHAVRLMCSRVSARTRRVELLDQRSDSLHIERFERDGELAYQQALAFLVVEERVHNWKQRPQVRSEREGSVRV